MSEMKLKHFLLLIILQLVNTAESKKLLEEKELWIEQKLDHFNESDPRTWQMRYLSSDTFFKPGGPLLININGEWPVEFNSPFSGFFYELVEMFNAYSMQTEHRYYGNSRPVKDMRVENLQYLSMKQALADLAHFIRHTKATMPALAKSKVILFGCSYTAGMVLFFRKDYPDLIDGGWSSCGVFYYSLDNADYLISVGNSIRKIGGDVCYDRIKKLSNSYLEHKRRNDAVFKEIKDQNLTQYFESSDELFSTNVQHRNISMMQKICRNVSSFDENDFIGFGRYLQLLHSKIPDLGTKNEIEFSVNQMSRQYFFQACNEVGNFQSTSSLHQPFGNMRPFSTFAAECKSLFGPKYTLDFINNKVDQMNGLFMDIELSKIHNIYFTKAEDDPWRVPGIPDEYATIMPGIGHCRELRAQKENDSPELKAARQRGIDLMQNLINGQNSSLESN